MSDLFFDWSGDDSNAWDDANLAAGRLRLVHDSHIAERLHMWSSPDGAPDYDPALAAALEEPDALQAYIAELEARRLAAAATTSYAPASYGDDPYRALLAQEAAARAALLANAYTPPAPAPSEQDDSLLSRLIRLFS